MKRVVRLMRTRGLRGKTRRKFKSTTDSKHKFPIAENKLERNFTAEKPDQTWLADITCLPTLKGFLFLAVVLDVFSRKRPCPSGASYGQEDCWLVDS